MIHVNKTGRFLSLLCVLLLGPATAQALTSFQALVDATPAGGTLHPKPGVYAGPATVSRQIVIDGGGKVTIDGGASGTVLTVKADGAVIRGLRLIRSGISHDQLNAAIAVEGNGNRIEENNIEEVLFGISLKKSNRNVVRRNRIRSRTGDIGTRGDALRLWYSFHNRIEENDVADARDIVFMNSPHNFITGNTIRNGRYAMQFVFSPHCLVNRNKLSNNATGIVLLNSDEMEVRGNSIFHSMGVTGSGIAIKKSTEILAQGNEIVHCSVGILSDSPVGEAGRITIKDNRIAHNTTGIQFYGERGGHTLIGNSFEKNLVQVAMFGSGGPVGNIWQDNFWDDYEGFDRNHDGIGDTPYEIYLHADRIWMETPQARFFRNAPALELLDFLERLAPFSIPDLIVRDTSPRFSRPAWPPNP